MIALGIFAPHPLQVRQLSAVFHTFSDYAHLEILRQSHNRPDNFDTVVLDVHHVDERAVDLQSIERQAMKLAE